MFDVAAGVPRESEAVELPDLPSREYAIAVLLEFEVDDADFEQDFDGFVGECVAVATVLPDIGSGGLADFEERPTESFCFFCGGSMVKKK